MEGSICPISWCVSSYGPYMVWEMTVIRESEYLELRKRTSWRNIISVCLIVLTKTVASGYDNTNQLVVNEGREATVKHVSLQLDDFGLYCHWLPDHLYQFESSSKWHPTGFGWNLYYPWSRTSVHVGPDMPWKSPSNVYPRQRCCPETKPQLGRCTMGLRVWAP